MAEHRDETLIARTVRTCQAMPSQWDAWTTSGQYLYLRYRHGWGSVERQPSPDPDSWTDHPATVVTEWNDGTGSGEITLAAFLAAAGLHLAPGAQTTGEPQVREYVRQRDDSLPDRCCGCVGELCCNCGETPCCTS